IQETNALTVQEIAYFAGEQEGKTFEKAQKFLYQFKHAKTIGSLLKLDSIDTELIEIRLKEIKSSPVDDWLDDQTREKILYLVPNLIKQSKIMGQRYDTVVTNPPYMNPNNNKELS